MPLTLTAADNGTSPPGVTLTAAGGTGGIVQFFSSPVGSAAWTLVGLRTGMGSLSAPLARGSYWFYALQSGAGTAAPVFAVVTDGTDSLPTRCRLALAARYAAVGLVNPENKRPLPVVSQIDPDETGIEEAPLVLLTLQAQTEQERDIKRDDWDMVGYPVRTSIVAREGTPPDHKNLPLYEGWRYKLQQAVRNQQLDGVPEVSRCVIEPLPIVDFQLPRVQHLVSEWVVRCCAAAPRGLGV